VPEVQVLHLVLHVVTLEQEVVIQYSVQSHQLVAVADQVMKTQTLMDQVVQVAVVAETLL
jgi:hypothetical protein